MTKQETQLKELLQKVLGNHDMEYVGDPQESIAVCRFCGEEATDDSAFCTNEKCNARKSRASLRHMSGQEQQTIANLGNIDWELLREQKLMLVRFYTKNVQSKSSANARMEEAFSGIIHLIDNIQDQAAEQLGEDVVFGRLVKTP